MNMILYVFVLVTVVECENLYNPKEFSYIFSEKDSMNWTEAKTECNNLGSELINWSESAEFKYILDYISWKRNKTRTTDKEPFWIGLRKSEIKFGWAKGEPNGENTDMCIVLKTTFEKYDERLEVVDCSAKERYACKLKRHPCDSGVNNCSRNADCKKTNKNSFTCDCKQNFLGDGFNCTGIHPCDNEHNNCSKHADCIKESETTFSCRCKQDFIGNGTYCAVKAFNPKEFSYTFYGEVGSWNDSRNACKKIGAELLYYSSKAEYQYILTILSKNSYWIGLNDNRKENDWRWENGDIAVYIGEWMPGEPNGGFVENCVILGSKGLTEKNCEVVFWVNYACKSRLLHEKNSTTTSTKESKSSLVVFILIPLLLILLLFIIIIGFLIRRRKYRIQRDKSYVQKHRAWVGASNQIIGTERSLGMLLSNLKDKEDDWEISAEKISYQEKIGEGSFGNVYVAIINDDELKLKNYLVNDKYAVKILKGSASELEKRDFLEEIDLMKKTGYHKHIMSIIGYSTKHDDKCLVLEYMPYGDLLNYLRKLRSTDFVTANNNNPFEDTEEPFSQTDLLQFALQISIGMEYLASMDIVHRDLAARNVLVGEGKLLKISDFGLARSVDGADQIYTGKNTRRLPVKWMSLEAIYNSEFTNYSDVWSFGVVFFEIVTLGGTPYPGLSNQDVLKLLKTGYRMEKPDNCADEIYDIMKSCWQDKPKDRPSFTDIRELFESHLSEDGEYITLTVDANKEYYLMPSFNSISKDSDDEELIPI